MLFSEDKWKLKHLTDQSYRFRILDVIVRSGRINTIEGLEEVLSYLTDENYRFRIVSIFIGNYRIRTSEADLLMGMISDESYRFRLVEQLAKLIDDEAPSKSLETYVAAIKDMELQLARQNEIALYYFADYHLSKMETNCKKLVMSYLGLKCPY